ncbi:hypothetical protein LTR60_007304, partial [Cryomyces antarcticus]
SPRPPSSPPIPRRGRRRRHRTTRPRRASRVNTRARLRCRSACRVVRYRQSGWACCFWTSG